MNSERRSSWKCPENHVSQYSNHVFQLCIYLIMNHPWSSLYSCRKNDSCCTYQCNCSIALMARTSHNRRLAPITLFTVFTNFTHSPFSPLSFSCFFVSSFYCAVIQLQFPTNSFIHKHIELTSIKHQ